MASTASGNMTTAAGTAALTTRLKVRRALATTALVSFVASPALRKRPYPVYRWFRRLDPVHASPLGVWVLARHVDVAAALRHPGLGSDEANVDVGALKMKLLSRVLSRDEPTAAPSGPFVEMVSRFLLFRDDPDHIRLRSLVAKAFTPRRVEALAPRVAELVEELLESIERRGHVELMSEFAYPLPGRVICELLGVPRADEALIIAQAPALATGLDPAPMRPAAAISAADEATNTVAGYLGGLIAERRRHPGDDLLSALIAAEDEGDRLSQEEIVATAVLLLIAGHETTANLIGNGITALLRHPDQLRRLRHDADLDRLAIEELLRFDGPVQIAQRITLDHLTIGGVTIPPGRIIILCTGAANHDPTVFENPDRLDLGRHPNPHVAFGGGPHFCIGASLARVEARIAIPAIVRRFPGLYSPARSPQWRPSFTVRGLRELQLSW